METRADHFAAAVRANSHPQPVATEFSEKVVSILGPRADDGPGTQSDDIYDSSMAPWRARLRAFVVRDLGAQSQLLAAMQDRMRGPFWDAYFMYTSSLGTHTFFLMFLPMFFFFGHERAGRGLLFDIGAGVYVTSFIKDLVCAPRPYSPPVYRISIASHHLEYGFPSTHSANSVSLAIFLTSIIYEQFCAGTISASVFCAWAAALVLYTVTIVFGRLYTGMHSFMDVAVGSLIGAGISGMHWAFGDVVERWVMTGGWEVPAILIAIALIMVNQHPQPVDDCPCFEDATACIAVIVGSFICKWHAVRYGFDASSGFFVSRTPGWQGRDAQDRAVWAAISALKFVFGILVIFAWRLLAKAVLHTVLPPTFRLAAQAFTLPTRRFYTPATAYTHVPAEKALQPIPSVIDLPASASAVLPHTHIYRALGAGATRRRAPAGGKASFAEEPAIDDGDVKHHDADVLTKVVVYLGIGVFACEALPVMFELLGWGVRM